jgi:hypothetical protein
VEFFYIHHGREVRYSLRASGSNLGALAIIIIMNFSTLVYNILLCDKNFTVGG